VLKINPYTQEVSQLGKLEPGGWKWHGGVTGRDGCIYGSSSGVELMTSHYRRGSTSCSLARVATLTRPFGTTVAGIPAHADSVLKVDPFAQEVSTIPFSYRCHHRDDRKYKYLGGVLGPDGRIYCIPSDADYVLRIDPQTCSATEIGPEIGTRATHCHISHNCNKWQNGFLAPDGLIYAIPLKSSAVLRIDPLRDIVDVVGGPFVGFEKWEGGVLSRLGAMYCIPLNSKQILKINPKVRISKDRKGQKRRVNDGKDKLGW
jgi:hypothetical protein